MSTRVQHQKNSDLRRGTGSSFKARDHISEYLKGLYGLMDFNYCYWGVFIIQMIDGRSGVRRGTLRSTSTGPSTGTTTPTATPIGLSIPMGDPLSGHTALDGTDPLSQFAREELDPLSRMAADEVNNPNNINIETAILSVCSYLIRCVTVGLFVELGGARQKTKRHC